MSVMASVKNFLTGKKIEQEKINAAQTVTARARSPGMLAAVTPFALAFVFMIVAVTAPASAALNLANITDLLNDFIGILPVFLDLMIAYAPIAVGGAIISAIIAFPKQILDMFKGMFQ